MSKLCKLTLSLSLFFTNSVLAEGLGREIWQDFISPVTTPARTPLFIGSGATLLSLALLYDVGDPLQRSWDERKPFGESAKVGDILGQVVPNALYFIGMGIDGWGGDDETSKARAILMFKATLYSGVVTQALKHTVRERRPNGTDTKSFPSGHASTAFAFASVVGAEHEWYFGLGAYSLATFVAATRINDNVHRLHDVIAGATIGISYGLGRYYRTHMENIDTVFQVLPTNRMDGMVLTGIHEF